MGKKKNILALVLLTSAVSILFFTANFLKIMLLHDPEKGLLKSNGRTLALNIAVSVGVLIILVLSAVITAKIYKPLSEKGADKTVALGVCMIAAAFCFIIQGSMDIISTLTAWRIEIISLLTSVLALFAGISFAVRGFGAIQLSEKKHFLLYLFPVLWATVSLLNLILTYPMFVSYQSLTEKLASAVFSLLLLYYVSKKELGYNSKKSNITGLFFILSAASVLAVAALPFGLASLCGVRDLTDNTPSLAYFGLTLYGAAAAASYVIKAEKALEAEPKQQ